MAPNPLCILLKELGYQCEGKDDHTKAEWVLAKEVWTLKAKLESLEERERP